MPSATAYFCLFFFLSASTSSPAPAESGEMRSFFFLFAASDSLCQLCCNASLPPSHMTKAAPVLLCVIGRLLLHVLCVCVCVRVLLFFFVVYWDLNRACFPVMFGQPCFVYCAFNLCCCSFNLLNFSHDKSACHRDFLTCELRSLWWQMEKFVSSLLVFAKKTFRDG